jgi:hypothetical protein
MTRKDFTRARAHSRRTNARAAAPRPPRPCASKSETTPSYGLFASPRSTRSGLNLSLPRSAAYTHVANPTNTSNNDALHPIGDSDPDDVVVVVVPACASTANPIVPITIASVRILHRSGSICSSSVRRTLKSVVVDRSIQNRVLEMEINPNQISASHPHTHTHVLNQRVRRRL